MNLSNQKITADQLQDSSESFCEQTLDEYIHIGIKNQLLSVQWLACKLEMSERHLLRLFKKHFNITCHKYLQNVKLKIAIDLLTKYPSISVKEMSSKLLFNDTKYFSKLFKQEFGMNPSEFKLKNLQS